MPLPDKEPKFKITFVQAVEKYNCLYDTASPQNNDNTLCGIIINYFVEREKNIQQVIKCSILNFVSE